MAHITLKGNPFNTIGELPEVGQLAPDFRLTKTDLTDISLADFAGKTKIINIVPSTDTPVCALSTRKFNDFTANHPDVVVLLVSVDLPFAQKRLCEGLDKVVALSTMRSPAFLKDYGVLITDGPMAGLSARAVLVLDSDNRVVYRQLVTEIADEPDYDSALRHCLKNATE